MTFEEFATARLPALMRYAFLLSTDRELARDIVQEVLARAMVRWSRIVRADDPYAYVRTMVTNEYFSLRRRKAVRTIALTYEALDGPRAPAHPDPTAVLGDRDELWRHLGALPRQQRAVIVLRYYEDLSDNQIAEVLGCSPGTVRGYAARAMATLRMELVEDPQPAPTNRGVS
jgi:RNA polymerase sigma-70 factor (sigma-E family)